VFWIVPPPGGAATRDAVTTAIATALGKRGTASSMVGRLAPGTVLVFDDLELWWERRAGGLDAIDAILELLAEAGDRIGFVLACSDAPLRVLRELRPVSRLAHVPLACEPLPARSLEKVIMARHGSSGIELKLAGRDSFGAWTRARLFDAHFAYSRGNVGYALRSWITHVESFENDSLTIRMPKVLDWSAIEDLSSEDLALLIELVLHKSASAAKLERLSERSRSAINDRLAHLTALGLVVQNRRRIAQLNPYVQASLLDWLRRNELT
jgi:hypothetical protein